ncbi:MAG: pyridoxal-phosphate dependent enzyme [Deltaproteobacteria bacterium]|nr:pyridoxal-phosphate dependent enzyme [Deltaproteobacteria bacterium]
MNDTQQAPRTAATDRTATADLALVRCAPGLAALPRHPLTQLPTPVAALTQLAARAGVGPLWIKRDDVSSPLYGGNKPRKLEWLLGAARARGRRGVITFGGIGTHHGLATALCARDAGLHTVLVLMPQPVTAHVRRCLLLHRAAGAEMHLAGGVGGIVVQSLLRCARGLLSGAPLAIIPTGGTSSLGAIGYVNAAFELAAQIRVGALPEPAAIVVPLGSGGTVAGLALGCKLAGLRTRVIGVLVTDILPPSARRLARLGNATLHRLRRAEASLSSAPLTAADLLVEPGFLGAGYGAVSEDGVAAARLIAECEGVALETTYTAKAVAALLALARRPEWRGRPLLFWNTYSSVDPAAALPPLPDWRALPPAFHRFFAD